METVETPLNPPLLLEPDLSTLAEASRDEPPGNLQTVF